MKEHSLALILSTLSVGSALGTSAVYAAPATSRTSATAAITRKPVAKLASAQDDAGGEAPKQSAQASAAGRDPTPVPTMPVVQPLQQVVVTGNAGTSPVTQLTASYAITTISANKLHDLAPPNTASILKTVPGVWVAASGGSDGNNVFVRGLPSGADSPFVTMEVDGSPLYALPNVGWTSTLDFFRLDNSVERVEVLQGGTSTLFGTGNPGVVFNVVTKDGTETPGGAGSVEGTIGPDGYDRIDAYWGGAIAPQWYVTVGGFGRKGDGVHDSQYPANLGGQWEATLTRTFNSRGKLSFGIRHTWDRGLFLTDSPVIVDNGNVEPYPGFDLRNAVLEGSDMRSTYLLNNSPKDNPADLADGRGIDLTVYRSDFSYRFDDDWFIQNNANLVTGSVPIVSLFNGSDPPESVGSFISGAISSANANPAIVAAAGGPATSGTAVFTHGGGPVNPNQLVLEANFLTNFEEVRSFTDELKLSKRFSNGNTLTAGLYTAQFSYHEDENSGNNMLLTLQNNAKLISVVLNNGVVVSSPDGFTSEIAGTQNVSAWKGDTVAGYLSDVQIIGPWTIQAGVREQHQSVSGRTEATTGANVDFDGNILTLYDNNANVLLPDAAPVRASYSFQKPSWTIGVNRLLSAQMSTFARVSNSYAFPGFGTITQSATGQQLVNEIREYAVGFKAEGSIYSLLIDGFYNTVTNSAFTAEIEPSPGVFQQVNLSGSTKAHGIEFDGTLMPVNNLSLEFNTTYLHALYDDYGVDSGNRIQDQPVLQWRFTPGYFMPLSWGALKAYASYEHVGERFQDVTNTQRLPAYYDIDAGIQAMVGEHWSFRLTGQNLTNQIGLTEGNGRSLTSGSNGVVYGRSIFGRTWRLSAKYSF